MLESNLARWLVVGGAVVVSLAVAGLLVDARAELLYFGLGLTVAYVLGAVVLSYTRCRTLVLRKRTDPDVES